MKSRGLTEEQKKNYEVEIEKLEKEKEEIRKKSDEEIKDTRIELEGKLEKMKEKMVSEIECTSKS
jgi:hypothetical protein